MGIWCIKRASLQYQESGNSWPPFSKHGRFTVTEFSNEYDREFEWWKKTDGSECTPAFRRYMPGNSSGTPGKLLLSKTDGEEKSLRKSKPKLRKTPSKAEGKLVYIWLWRFIYS